MSRQAVEVPGVDHGRGPGDPRVGPPGLGVAALLRAVHPGLLLGLAGEQDALLVRLPGQVDLGLVVLDVFPLGLPSEAERCAHINHVVGSIHVRDRPIGVNDVVQ
jgi:hypothetical protein